MSYGFYDSVAQFYDLLNDSVDYPAWADFITRVIEKYKKVPTSLVLDLGCGTGKMTFLLRERGFDMTGVDNSPEMLSVAMETCRKEKINDVLLLCQDMTDFELYGTVDAAVCCLDCINHLTKPADVKKCFSLVHNYLAPDGLFIFDLNTPFKFETVYADRSYILEDEGVLVAWQNSYNSKSKLCGFYISSFIEKGDGSYRRCDSAFRERCYTERSVRRMLSDAGFEILFISSDYTESPASPDAERWYIAARCIK